MKKRILSVIIGCLLVSSSVVFADEVNTTVDPTITTTTTEAVTTAVDPTATTAAPYTADQLYEDLKSMFNLNSQEEASLLLQFAQEQLAIAGDITVDQKTEFLQKVANTYVDTLKEVQQDITTPAEDSTTSTTIGNQTSGGQQDTTDVNGQDLETPDQSQENMDEETQESLKEKLDDVSFTANVIKNIDMETVKKLREEGFGFGQITHIVLLSQASEKSVDEIATLVSSEKGGFGNIERQLAIKPNEIMSKIESKKAKKTSESTALKLDTEIKDKKQQLDKIKEATEKQTKDKKTIDNSNTKENGTDQGKNDSVADASNGRANPEKKDQGKGHSK